MTGTAIKCDCCHDEVLAVAYPALGGIKVTDRRHGTHHTRFLTLEQVVRQLDPHGTTYRQVGGSANGH